MTEILEFKPRPKPEQKINIGSSYNRSRKLVGTVEIYDDQTINTMSDVDNYYMARCLLQAAMSVIGTAEGSGTQDDKILTSMVRTVNDIITLQAEAHAAS